MNFPHFENAIPVTFESYTMTSCCIYLSPIRLKSLMKPDLKPTAIVSSNSEATIKEGGSVSEVLNS
jgi:hypothetical protein